MGEGVYEQFKHWDLGDILGAEGTLFRTRTGELSVNVSRVRLLAKSLRPLPEKFHGMADQEQRYRQRYLDLITNPESQRVFKARSRIIQTIREFFVARGYLEVETPMMQPIPGGAAARPFVTHHNALDMQLYLRIAPELYLKRLVVGGMEKVFEINRSFRNEGISTRHNPEFTMLEFYEAYRDYHYLMDLTEELLREVAQKVPDGTTVSYQGEAIELGKPFDRLTMAQAIAKYNPRYPVHELDKPEYLRVALAPFDIEVFPTDGLGLLQLMLFEQTTESKLIQPTFIVALSDRGFTARAPERRQPGGHRSLRAVHHRTRDRQRFFGAERPRRSGGAFPPAGQAKEAGNEEAMFYDADYMRARVRVTACGGRGHRHRPAGDADDRQPQHPRRDTVSSDAAGVKASAPSLGCCPRMDRDD